MLERIVSYRSSRAPDPPAFPSIPRVRRGSISLSARHSVQWVQPSIYILSVVPAPRSPVKCPRVVLSIAFSVGTTDRALITVDVSHVPALYFTTSFPKKSEGRSRTLCLTRERYQATRLICGFSNSLRKRPAGPELIHTSKHPAWTVSVEGGLSTLLLYHTLPMPSQ